MLKQILIIERDEQCLRLLSGLLDGIYECQSTRSCSEAFGQLNGKRSSKISAVLINLDNGLDDTAGFLTMLNGTPGLKDLPVLILAGSLEDFSHLRGIPRGIYDYLQIPQDADALRFRLKNLIARSEYTAYEKYRYSAEYDAVSGIYNRERFFDATKRLIDSRAETFFVVGWFDLDRFKAYNDLFGMKEGDRLLSEIGRFFHVTFSADATYGRIAADHFVFCLPRERLDEEALIGQFLRRFSAYQPNFVISPRIGIYPVEDRSLDVNIMCDRAYMALRSIKAGSPKRYACYNETMRSRILEEQTLIGDVQTALREEQFEVYLQPQYNHHTGALVGAEALVRWNHPVRGLITPASFIPILEKNGLITQLDLYVWTQVCKLLRRWRDAGLPQISVSVNVSRADIQSLDLCRTILQLTRESDVKPQDLRLEITETAYTESAELLIDSVRSLQSEGFLIEMDDFGKGQSSLNTLKNVPVDVLKLDLGFLKETGSIGTRSGVILNSILQMAHWLNLAVIAEGVETLQQADYLCSIGCNIVQGYLYAQPMSAEQFRQLLEGGKTERFFGEDLLLSQLNEKELWDPDANAASIFRRFLGAAGVFELCDGTVTAIRSSQKLGELMEVDFSDLSGPASDVLSRVAPDQQKKVLALFISAAKTGRESTGRIRYQTPVSNVTLQLFLRILQVGLSAKRRVFLVACEDITSVFTK